MNISGVSVRTTAAAGPDGKSGEVSGGDLFLSLLSSLSEKAGDAGEVTQDGQDGQDTGKRGRGGAARDGDVLAAWMSMLQMLPSAVPTAPAELRNAETEDAQVQSAVPGVGAGSFAAPDGGFAVLEDRLGAAAGQTAGSQTPDALDTGDVVPQVPVPDAKAESTSTLTAGAPQAAYAASEGAPTAPAAKSAALSSLTGEPGVTGEIRVRGQSATDVPAAASPSAPTPAAAEAAPAAGQLDVTGEIRGQSAAAILTAQSPAAPAPVAAEADPAQTAALAASADVPPSGQAGSSVPVPAPVAKDGDGAEQAADSAAAELPVGRMQSLHKGGPEEKDGAGTGHSGEERDGADRKTTVPVSGGVFSVRAESGAAEIGAGAAAKETGTVPVPEQVSEKITQNLKEGKTSFEMELSPEGLGKISVSIVCEKEKLTLHITAGLAETRELLEHRAGELRAALSDKAYELSDMVVSVKNSDSAGAAGTYADFSSGNGRQNAWREPGGQTYESRNPYEQTEQKPAAAGWNGPKEGLNYLV